WDPGRCPAGFSLVIQRFCDYLLCCWRGLLNAATAGLLYDPPGGFPYGQCPGDPDCGCPTACGCCWHADCPEEGLSTRVPCRTPPYYQTLWHHGGSARPAPGHPRRRVFLPVGAKRVRQVNHPAADWGAGESRWW